MYTVANQSGFEYSNQTGTQSTSFGAPVYLTELSRRAKIFNGTITARQNILGIFGILSLKTQNTDTEAYRKMYRDQNPYHRPQQIPQLPHSLPLQSVADTPQEGTAVWPGRRCAGSKKEGEYM